MRSADDTLHVLGRSLLECVDRMLRTETSRGKTAQEVIANLSDAVCAFQEPAPPADDITIVAIRRLPVA